jgi:outer membrane protein TolC
LFAGQISPSFTSDSYWGSQLSLQQPIFMWGRMSHTNKQSRINYRIAGERFRQARGQVVYSAKEQFFRAILAQRMLEIARRSRDLTSQRYARIRVSFEEGRVSAYDVARTSVSLTNENVNLLRAENTFRQSLDALKNFLNISEEIELRGELAYAVTDYQLGVISERALANRPEIKQAAYQAQFAQSTLVISNSANKPMVSASFTDYVQTADPATSFNDWDNRWQASVGLTWQVFDGLYTRGQTKQARASLRQAEINAQAVRDTTALNVRTAYGNFGQSKQSIELQRENVALARQNVDFAEKRYEIGLITYLELQDVQLSLAQAEQNYQQALFDHTMAIAQIELLQGE